MKHFAKAVLGVVAAALLSANANAQVKIQINGIQIKGGQLIGRYLPTYLLNSPDVQKDLGLGEKQLADLKKIFADQTKALQDLPKGNKNIKERIEKSNKVRKATNDAIAQLLGKDKMNRLNQIQKQMNGPTRYVKELNITKDQLKDIQGVRKNMIKERSEVVKNNKGNAQAIRDGLAKLTDKMNKKILDVLSDDQKAEWEKMTGKPFKGKLGRGAIGVLPIQRPNIQIRPVPLKKLRPKKAAVPK